MYQNFISYLREAQHVSGDTPPIIRSLKLHWQPVVLHAQKVVGRVVAGQLPATRPTTFCACKTRGCQCSFRLLIMGGVSPETCWVSRKYEIKFWYTVASCWIFYMNYVFKIQFNIILHCLGLPSGLFSSVSPCISVVPHIYIYIHTHTHTHTHASINYK